MLWLEKSPTSTGAAPLLRSLHWLPVNFRIDFKICLLTYKTLCEKQPVYLLFVLVTSLPSRSLWSRKRITLSVPGVKTSAGARAFYSCASALWNSPFRPSFHCNYLETCQNRLLDIITIMPNGLLTSWTVSWILLSDIDSGCSTTEAGLAGILMLIEIKLFASLIDKLLKSAKRDCFNASLWTWRFWAHDLFWGSAYQGYGPETIQLRPQFLLVMGVLE